MKNQCITKKRKDDELTNPAEHNQALLNEIHFILVNVDGHLAGDYIRYQSNVSNVSNVSNEGNIKVINN